MNAQPGIRQASSGEKFAKAVRRGRPKKWVFHLMGVGDIVIVEAPNDHAAARSAAARTDGEFTTRKLDDGTLLVKRKA